MGGSAFERIFEKRIAILQKKSNKSKLVDIFFIV